MMDQNRDVELPTQTRVKGVGRHNNNLGFSVCFIISCRDVVVLLTPGGEIPAMKYQLRGIISPGSPTPHWIHLQQSTEEEM